MHQFFAPDIEQTRLLPEDESLHCSRVLRLERGTVIAVADGKGNRFLAVIIEAHPKNTVVEIVEKQHVVRNENNLIHIAVATTKNKDRFEWFVEKATEIGADIITPLFSHHVERKQISMDRLQKIAVAAFKQSQRAYLPLIQSPASFDDIVQKSTEKQRFIAHCYDEQRIFLSSVYRPFESSLVLIGPEGDFTMEEVEKALAHHFVPILLGNNRLRTETAGIVACHTLEMLRNHAK
ncbi:MAG: 16S rRNA (uracil(1498)-N(3))-methyltransferase [Microbacter sp.]